MKLWNWIKSLSWIALAGAIGAGALMVLNAYRAGKMEEYVATEEGNIKRLEKGTVRDVEEAIVLQDHIAERKVKAREIRKKAEKHQERIGQDETMADIAERFNGKRVRSRKDAAG